MSLPISIIVPVYNAGVHFTTLLDSILAQTFTQFELILVLDCPTDGSDKVAKRYAQNDKRIVIVENEHNLHIGYSRNKGLQLAKGNYIAFADHDDYVQPTWLEVLYNKALETNADVVVCDIENIKDTEHIVGAKEMRGDYYAFPKVDGQTLRQGMLQAMLCSRHSVANSACFDNANSVWNQLYKKELLTKNGMQFTDNKLVSYEDALFNIPVFLHAQRVAYVAEALYVHIMHQNNEFSNYAYKCEEKLTAYLLVLQGYIEAFNLPTEYMGQAVMRKYFVCLFNEYKHQGLWATISLLFRLRNHPFKAAVKAYRTTKPALSVAKKIFLFWLS